MKFNQAITAAFLSATVESSAAFSRARDGGEIKDKIAPLFAAATEGSHHLQRMLNEPEVSAECLADADLMDLKFELIRYGVMLSCLEAETVEGSTSVLDFSVCDPAFTIQLEEACDALGGELKNGFDDVRIDCPEQTVISNQFHHLCFPNSCASTIDNLPTDVVSDAFSQAYLVTLANNFPGCTVGVVDSLGTFELGSSAGKATSMIALAATSAAAALFFF
uniref:Uncharacterized protein n=1 Tax=Skeletonema marinoi TaxID=267567 RepID=A0A7S2PZD0_9STRA|mmetsp:Transcript_668/g.1066  ORF Transcript_668/g.1066 Transcript_668/m.1066 type:complete len:221 (+) Transcript_668:50-712(+)